MAAAAVFDLDGTLITFAFDIRDWRKRILALMKDHGFGTDGLEPGTPTQQILDSAKSQARGGDLGRYEKLRAEAYSILDDLELKGAEVSTVFPHAVETLRLLRSKGVRLCILTNSGRSAAAKSLEKSDLTGYFEFVLTRDDTETMKPRPEGLAMAVRMLGLGPDDVCYVGDSPFDVVAAKKAGVRAVSVATGNYTAERLRGEGADYVIDDLSELPRALGV